jgi:hypothetical protein
MCISTVVVGAATDRFGVNRIAVPTLLVLIASAYGLYRGAEAMPAALLPIYALAGFGAGGVVLTPIMMIHAFQHRYDSAGSHSATTSPMRCSED